MEDQVLVVLYLNRLGIQPKVRPFTKERQAAERRVPPKVQPPPPESERIRENDQPKALTFVDEEHHHPGTNPKPLKVKTYLQLTFKQKVKVTQLKDPRVR